MLNLSISLHHKESLSNSVPEMFIGNAFVIIIMSVLANQNKLQIAEYVTHLLLPHGITSSPYLSL